MVVVGAGLAGLAAARDVAAAGRSVVVLEARERVGGRVENHVFADGSVVELGGQWVGPTQDRVLALAADLGLDTYPTYDVGDYLTGLPGRVTRYRGDTFGLRPHVIAEALVTQRRLERMARSVPLDAPWRAAKATRWDGGTLADWLRRNVRSRTGRAFWAIATSSVFAAEPADISLLHFLFYVHSGGSLDRLLGTRDGAQERRVRGGSQLLADRVARRCDVRLGRAVVGIDHSGGSVTVADAGGGRWRAERVVVAVPPHLVARMDVDPPLPPLRTQLQQKMPMGSVVKCMARYERPFWRDDGLAGFAASMTDPVSLVFDNTPDGAGGGVLVGFAEGDHARHLGTLGEEERRRLVLATFTRFFGPAAARPLEYVERDWATEQWTGGCYGAHLAPGVWTAFGPALREACGRIHWAGTETAEVWCGYMDGALRSGERAAAEALAALGSPATGSRATAAAAS